MSRNDADDSQGRRGIRAVRLSKWYGKVTALQDVSLHLEPGLWGLLGPNGSGKTTFLRCIAGQLKPSLGEVRVCRASRPSPTRRRCAASASAPRRTRSTTS